MTKNVENARRLHLLANDKNFQLIFNLLMLVIYEYNYRPKDADHMIIPSCLFLYLNVKSSFESLV